MDKWHVLLNQVIKKTDALKAAQALYSRQLAPNFNTFDFINTSELGLSRIVADLLNPSGSHGQKEAFLRLFVEYCLPIIHQKWHVFLDHIEQTKVVVEEMTWASGTRRRMDIYLECQTGDESFGICIENKPYALDQNNQLKDYAIELENRKHKAWHIVYLNDASDGPSKDSVDSPTLENWSQAGKFTALPYSSLLEWLNACKTECQNHSVNEFISQLIKFIQKQFMGIEDMNEDNAILDIMGHSEDNIEASLKIAKNIKTMKSQLIKKLKMDLIERIDACGYKYRISEAYDGNYEQHIVFAMIEGIGFIRFEFNGKSLNAPFLGIKLYKDNVHSAESSDMNKALNHVFAESSYNMRTKSSEWWPVHYNFQPKDWENSSDAWQMIHTGEMAIKILAEVEAIYKVLADSGYTLHS